MASYVDNLVFFGSDASAVEATHACAEIYLDRAWGLRLPRASTEVLVPRGAPVVPAAQPATGRMRWLGHVLDDAGSCFPCFRAARVSVLGRAHAQMAKCRRAFVPVSQRIRALDTVVFPVISYRAPSWAPSTTLLAEVDALQRRCASLAEDVRPYPLEDIGAFRRRRGRIAAVALAGTRSWSRRVVELASARLAECTGSGALSRTWLGALLAYKPEEWLAERRVARGSASVAAGRIGARAGPGRVAPRYECTTKSAAREYRIRP